jgi:hypothetical protein
MGVTRTVSLLSDIIIFFNVFDAEGVRSNFRICECGRVDGDFLCLKFMCVGRFDASI